MNLRKEKLKYEIEENKRLDDMTTKEVSGSEIIDILTFKDYVNAKYIYTEIEDFLNGYLDKFEFQLKGIFNKEVKITQIEISFTGIIDTNYTAVSVFERHFEDFISEITE